LIVIAGAGGLAKEIAEAILATVGPVAGYLDDAELPPDVNHLGSCDTANVPRHLSVITGFGDPATRYRVAKRLEGVRFTTVIHPTATVSPTACIGAGVYVGAYAYVGPDAEIGDHAVINVRATVGHDASVGRCAVLSPHANLNGAAAVGEGTFLGTAAAVSVGIEVGPWSKVAAAAVVMRNAPGGMLLAGSPATGRTMFRRPS
jgi:sugar O-acyltransferase (sialic acid O-acetyltransferase NeuD family)